MKRYSKPLGRLLEFKQDFFRLNDIKLEEFRKIAAVYRSQGRRVACKNCAYRLNFSVLECFTKMDVEYAFCPHCGHCNGVYEDTEAFCRFLYTDDHGVNYAKNYSANDRHQYNERVAEIYFPKARFLREALLEAGEHSVCLSDFGAGGGYFVAAAKECGFNYVTGYEPSQTLVDMGNAMIGSGVLIKHDLDDLVSIIDKCEEEVVSFFGVLEHLRNPRAILEALGRNKQIRYIFFSVPLFSPTVVFESVFTEIMPRHLIAGHTHLYSEQSIQFFCDEFGFQRLSEWWFGLDMTDLSRSILVSLQDKHSKNPLKNYWTERVMPLIDKMQFVLDEAKCCSEVHMLIGKKI